MRTITLRHATSCCATTAAAAPSASPVEQRVVAHVAVADEDLLARAHRVAERQRDRAAGRVERDAAARARVVVEAVEQRADLLEAEEERRKTTNRGRNPLPSVRRARVGAVAQQQAGRSTNGDCGLT